MTQLKQEQRLQMPAVLSVRFTDPLLERYRQIVAAEGLTVPDVTRRLVYDYVKRQQGGNDAQAA